MLWIGTLHLAYVHLVCIHCSDYVLVSLSTRMVSPVTHVLSRVRTLPHYYINRTLCCTLSSLSPNDNVRIMDIFTNAPTSNQPLVHNHNY